MKIIRILSLCCAGSALAATGAVAGGYIAPVTDVPIVPAAPMPAPVSDWAGGYAGVSLGYSFSGEDEVGFEFYSGDSILSRETDVANEKLKGVTGDIHAGYRWQRNNWVFGPELAIEGGSVDASNDFTLLGGPASLESSIKYVATLAFKTGYLVNPQTMVYGTGGFVHGKFDYELAAPGYNQKESYTANGFTLGLGVERKVNERMSVFAEYQYRDFGRTDVTFNSDDGDTSALTIATPEHQNIKVGVNFSF